MRTWKSNRAIQSSTARFVTQNPEECSSWCWEEGASCCSPAALPTMDLQPCLLCRATNPLSITPGLLAKHFTGRHVLAFPTSWRSKDVITWHLTEAKILCLSTSWLAQCCPKHVCIISGWLGIWVEQVSICITQAQYKTDFCCHNFVLERKAQAVKF